MNDQQLVRLSIGQLAGLVETALRRVGMSEENVAVITNTIVASECDGARGHGLLRLPGFVHSVKIGWVDGKASPKIVTEAPSLVVVDAQNGFAQRALAHVRPRLVAMVRNSGCATLLTRNSHHFAALWPDIEEFAVEGFIALTCVNSRKRMSVWSGTRPVTGTNAMAFACPRPDHLPLVWDQSSSVQSQGDVLLAVTTGQDVPPGVGCDASGAPTTSPAAILDGGALLPFGGNKGASIAVMIEILAAALTGSPFGFEDGLPAQTAATSKGGQFLLVIDPRRCNNSFDARVSSLFEALMKAGATRFPGDRRYRARQISRMEGIRIDAATYAMLLRFGNAEPHAEEGRGLTEAASGQ
jgi:delta1-piperideine-2-carboxylate reductase